MTRFGAVLILLGGLMGMGGEGVWASNSCVQCHQRAETARALPSWYQDLFIHWYGSVHGKNEVTCDKCHRGDPAQANKELAHKGVMSIQDSASSVYYKNLPETCGSCHEGVYKNFIRSRHYQRLKADRLAPTCTTCHGFQMDVGGVSLSRMAGRCTLCHNPQKGIKPEVADQLAQTLKIIADTEDLLQKAEVAVEFSKEKGRKLEKEEGMVGSARVRMKKMGELWHRFQLSSFEKEMVKIQRMAAESYSAAKQLLMSDKEKDMEAVPP